MAENYYGLRRLILAYKPRRESNEGGQQIYGTVQKGPTPVPKKSVRRTFTTPQRKVHPPQTTIAAVTQSQAFRSRQSNSKSRAKTIPINPNIGGNILQRAGHLPQTTPVPPAATQSIPNIQLKTPTTQDASCQWEPKCKRQAKRMPIIDSDTVKMGTLVPQEAAKAVRCSACNFQLSYFPIYFTPDNVGICGRCSPHLIEAETSLVRNTTYEAIAQFLKFPCIFEKEGCLENLLPSEVPKHETVCPFRQINCIMDCVWQGNCNELFYHFQATHPTLILQGGEFEIDLLGNYEQVNIVTFQDEVFGFKRVFNAETRSLSCYITCYFLIDPTIQYFYEISVENGTAKGLTVRLPAQPVVTNTPTEIDADSVIKRLNDPTFIIGKIRIFEQDNPPDENVTKPELNLEVLSDLECPVCFEYIAPPIYQCVTGHIICKDCKTQVLECPSCKCEIKNTQNFQLEKVVARLDYPCKFSDYGCNFVTKPHKIKEHQEYCSFGPQDCPVKDYEKCPWEGSAKQILKHVVEQHHDNLLDIDTVREFISNGYYDADQRFCYILRFAKEMFKLHYLCRQNKFYWAMQFLGPPVQAKDYKFEVDIVDNSNNNRRVYFRNFCAPLTDKDHCFEDASQYIALDLDSIKEFISDTLTYRVRIIK